MYVIHDYVCIHIYHVLASELLYAKQVYHFDLPLCSDAYSNFTSSSYNDNVDAATRYMQWEVCT